MVQLTQAEYKCINPEAPTLDRKYGYVSNGYHVFISEEMVPDLIQHLEGATEIWFGNKNVYVMESPEEVNALLTSIEDVES